MTREEPAGVRIGDEVYVCGKDTEFGGPGGARICGMRPGHDGDCGMCLAQRPRAFKVPPRDAMPRRVVEVGMRPTDDEDRAIMEELRKCSECGGSKTVNAVGYEYRPGVSVQPDALVLTPKPCPACNGTGRRGT